MSLNEVDIEELLKRVTEVDIEELMKKVNEVDIGEIMKNYIETDISVLLECCCHKGVRPEIPKTHKGRRKLGK